MLRRQPPVHSPTGLRALVAGAAGAAGLAAHQTLTRRISEHWNARNVLLTSSGTVALSLAMRAWSRAGHKLIALPAYGCFDLATAADGADVRIVLYDVDPTSLAPDVDSLRRALEREPAALVLAHLYGIPLNVPELARQAADRGVAVIEDAAQAIGAETGGRAAGSFGSVSLLSFGRGKGLTGGSGGALLSHDDAGDRALAGARSLVEKSSAGWSDVARAGIQWIFGRPALYALPSALPFLRLGETVYRAPEPVHGLSRAAGRMVLENWAAALSAVSHRRRVAARLQAAARQWDTWRTFVLPAGRTGGYLRFPLLAEVDVRSVLNDGEARRLGIASSYPAPLNRLPGFASRCINANEQFPGAEHLAARLFTLPAHELLTQHDLSALERWLAQTAASLRGKSV
ncbi:MAG: DegT/DnrJ/EryC1/StrS family aminotransferase [Pseudomonas sp.]